jgi:glycosyltransferase involved in cell wall biosynthesis
LLKLCATGLVGGRAHADYLAKLGFAPDNIFLGYDAVDNHYFSKHAAEIRSRANDYRGRINLPQNYFLASARFVEKKNLSRLIQAYADYRKLSRQTGKDECPGEPWDLVLLGDGALREDISKQIAALGLTQHVILPGFKQYDELPVYYAFARAFIHASTTEQWGLVVNEAMASGLPVLVSNRCGCSVDLIEEGVTGYSFDPHNQAQMADLMLRLTMKSTDLPKMGQAAEKRVAEWGVERFASGLKQAAESGMKAHRQKPSLMDWLQIKLLLLHKGRVST